MQLLLRYLLAIERAVFGALPEPVRFNTRIELTATVTYGAFYAASLAFLPVVLRRLGASTDQLALYVSLTYLGQLLAPLGLSLMRRFGALRFATVWWGLGRGLFGLAWFVADPAGLLGLALVLWVAETLPSPAYAQIMQQMYPPAYRGRAMSGVRVGMAVMVLLLSPLVGWLLDRVGHQPLFVVAALFGVVAAALFALVRPVAPAAPPPPKLAAREMLRLLGSNRPFAVYLLALTVYGLGSVMVLPLFPVVQVSRLGLSYTEIGALGLLQSVFWLAGYTFWGRVMDRRGPAWLLGLAMLLMAAVAGTYGLATNIWTLAPAFVAQGLLMGAFDLGAFNTAIELAEPDRVPEYTALQTAVIGLRGMVAPSIGAALLAAGLPMGWLFGLCVALILVATLILRAARPPARAAR